MIAQIKLLQSACNSYCLAPDPAFLHWFRNQPQYSEEERYTHTHTHTHTLRHTHANLQCVCCSYALSCDIEGLGDSSPSSPKHPKSSSMVKRLSL